MAKKLAMVGTTSMIQYFKPIREHGISNIMRIAREQYRNDAFAKKERHKVDPPDAPKLQQRTLNVTVSRRLITNCAPQENCSVVVKQKQPPITNFLSLHQSC